MSDKYASLGEHGDILMGPSGLQLDNQEMVDLVNNLQAENERLREKYESTPERGIEVELGHGDKLVTDIYGDDWAGIAISDGDCPVGEFADTGAKIVSDLDPIVTVITGNPKSLDVIIQAVTRAKARLTAEDIEKDG